MVPGGQTDLSRVNMLSLHRTAYLEGQPVSVVALILIDIQNNLYEFYLSFSFKMFLPWSFLKAVIYKGVINM